MSSEMIATWMGVFVGALGVLFAAGAIVVTFLLFRQTAEHRRLIQSAVDVFLTEARVQFAAVIAKLEADSKSLHQKQEAFGADVAREVRETTAAELRRVDEMLATLRAARRSTERRYRTIRFGGIQQQTVEDRIDSYGPGPFTYDFNVSQIPDDLEADLRQRLGDRINDVWIISNVDGTGQVVIFPRGEAGKALGRRHFAKAIVDAGARLVDPTDG